MASKPKATLAPTEIPFVIEGLRKLALQRDTLRKYALDETSDSFDEDKAEGYTEDITSIRSLLANLGDTKPLVLKSERKAKAKPKAKATKAKAKGKAKPKAVAITKAQALLAEDMTKASEAIAEVLGN
ncbi:hypothetical protein UFOVP325_25 [uncultured Caudovirales phage]|uniref:Uncharacterized protein n=1 Tax=uncultured Caudovirales phage TaxID=2100421 RepID=A0A6J5LSX5_9CAUD|nr:hypothetical protein UFOVP325_25 [uncultured Caudovirales phage]CAB4147294.1 hypothetical protein UFOVP430_20 [uncultured Caudovirales phage]